MPLENNGPEESAHNHFEKEFFGNEIMIADTPKISIFSKFTLSLLMDSGLFIVDLNQAEPSYWGRNAGCQFFSGVCTNQFFSSTSQTFQSNNSGQTFFNPQVANQPVGQQPRQGPYNPFSSLNPLTARSTFNQSTNNFTTTTYSPPSPAPPVNPVNVYNAQPQSFQQRISPPNQFNQFNQQSSTPSWKPQPQANNPWSFNNNNFNQTYDDGFDDGYDDGYGNEEYDYEYDYADEQPDNGFAPSFPFQRILSEVPGQGVGAKYSCQQEGQFDCDNSHNFISQCMSTDTTTCLILEKELDCRHNRSKLIYTQLSSDQNFVRVSTFGVSSKCIRASFNNFSSFKPICTQTECTAQGNAYYVSIPYFGSNF